MVRATPGDASRRAETRHDRNGGLIIRSNARKLLLSRSTWHYFEVFSPFGSRIGRWSDPIVSRTNSLFRLNEDNKDAIAEEIREGRKDLESIDASTRARELPREDHWASFVESLAISTCSLFISPFFFLLIDRRFLTTRSFIPAYTVFHFEIVSPIRSILPLPPSLS